MEFAIVQIASVDMLRSPCYKFGDAQQRRLDKNLLAERKKKKIGRRRKRRRRREGEKERERVWVNEGVIHGAPAARFPVRGRKVLISRNYVRSAPAASMNFQFLRLLMSSSNSSYVELRENGVNTEILRLPCLPRAGTCVIEESQSMGGPDRRLSYLCSCRI
ncbi:hypothetical protein ALC60_14670 [Trachymyrmex zeteki]|uniref:Uncharacterized protein n=1 Tax=Mycetomoellerius zeteki TaxID=64791 RepID=A0A151WEF5_9HYME|nr:hypothetical protein ALC60_14670 [Trachymyrmex zeteki]